MLDNPLSGSTEVILRPDYGSMMRLEGEVAALVGGGHGSDTQREVFRLAGYKGIGRKSGCEEVGV